MVVRHAPQHIGLLDVAHLGFVVELKGGHTHRLGHVVHGQHGAVYVNIHIWIPLLQDIVLRRVVLHTSFQLQGVRIDNHRIHVDIQLAGSDAERRRQGLLFVQDIRNAHIDVRTGHLGIEVHIIHLHIQLSTNNMRANQFCHLGTLALGRQGQGDIQLGRGGMYAVPTHLHVFHIEVSTQLDTFQIHICQRAQAALGLQVHTGGALQVERHSVGQERTQVRQIEVALQAGVDKHIAHQVVDGACNAHGGVAHLGIQLVDFHLRDPFIGTVRREVHIGADPCRDVAQRGGQHLGSGERPFVQFDIGVDQGHTALVHHAVHMCRQLCLSVHLHPVQALGDKRGQHGQQVCHLPFVRLQSDVNLHRAFLLGQSHIAVHIQLVIRQTERGFIQRKTHLVDIGAERHIKVQQTVARGRHGLGGESLSPGGKIAFGQRQPHASAQRIGGSRRLGTQHDVGSVGAESGMPGAVDHIQQQFVHRHLHVGIDNGMQQRALNVHIHTPHFSQHALREVAVLSLQIVDAQFLQLYYLG